MARTGCSIATLFLLLSSPSAAESVRAHHPALAGVNGPFHVLVDSDLLEIDDGDLAERIRRVLLEGGLAAGHERAPSTLKVRIVSSWIEEPACADTVSVQVVLSLQEEVMLARKPKLRDVQATVWTYEGESMIRTEADAAGHAVSEALHQVAQFVDEVAYSTSQSVRYAKSRR